MALVCALPACVDAVDALPDAAVAEPAAAVAEPAAAVALAVAASDVAVLETVTQAEPVYTRISLDTVLKYRAPVSRAAPSLSSVGLADLLPKKRSSNAS